MTGGSLDLLRFSHLSREPWLEHGISTRHGGVSEGRCATLNTSFTVGDDESHVEENLARIARAVGTERNRLFAAYQVHSNTATVVDALTPGRPRCDILVTRAPERTLMLRFADCTPMVLADPVRRAVGVAHAGWRGTAQRAANAAVRAMVEAFDSKPEDLLVGVGPSIGPCCYTVGQEVVDAFADRPWVFAVGGDGTMRLDLWEANRRGLLEAGVPSNAIEVSQICTQCHADEFFSHRANGGHPAGRFAALVRLT